MNIGVYVGSFDPLHIGHIAVIQQAERMFDNVIIGVGVNGNKKASTSGINFRVDKIKHQLPFYKVYQFFNVFEFVNMLKNLYPYDRITIIRGVRDANDLDAAYIEILHQNLIDSILIKTPNKYQHISSGAIRELKRIGEDDRCKGWEPAEKKIIGITGKICCGKSTYMNSLDNSRGFAKLNIDELVRTEIISYCAAHDIIVDMDKVKKYVFSDDELMKLMIALTKPLVSKRIRIHFLCSGYDTFYVEDPMMLEQGRVDLYDEIHYIECDEGTLVNRLMKRNDLVREEANYRLSYFQNTVKENVPAHKLKLIKGD